MEMLIFLNGILFTINVLHIIKDVRCRKGETLNLAGEKELEGEKLTPSEQWENMMNYDGTKQGGALREN